jgi:WD40 repeat protein
LDIAEEISSAVTSLLSSSGAHRLLVVLDQAEQLFTRTSEEARERFAILLREATAGPMRVVATLRSDHLDPLSRLAADTSLPVATFLLNPLNRDMLRLVITGPAREAGIGIDDELVARLVDDTGGGEALPLLAFVLERLAGVRRGGALSAEDYERLGGVQGALRGQANDALAAARAATRRTESDVLNGLLRLVKINDFGQVASRPIPKENLPEEVRDELQEFVGRRLLTVDRENNREVLVVTHEHILTAWSPLAAAIGRATERLRLTAAVENDAEIWQRQGRPTSHLWRDDRAAVAETTLGPAADDLDSNSREFLNAAREHGRRRRFTTRAVAGSLITLVAVSLMIAIFEWRGAVGRGKATERARLAAVAESLIARADAVSGSDPRAALRYDVAADSIASGPHTQSNILGVLASTPHLHSSLRGHEGSVRAVATTGDGAILATGGDDRTVILWDLRDSARPGRFGSPLRSRTGGAVRSLAFTSDGATLAVGGDDGTIILWNVGDPNNLRPLGGPIHSPAGGAVQSVAFRSDSAILAVGSDGGTSLWSVTDPGQPRLLGSLPEDRVGASQPGAQSVAFADDGTLLAVGRDDGATVLWNVSDTRKPRAFSGPLRDQVNSAVQSVAFSADSTVLGVGSDTGTELWNVADPVRPRRLGEIHQERTRSAVRSIAFSDDSDTLATGGDDHAVSLWNIHNPAQPRRLVAPLRGHTGTVRSIVFRKNGQLVSGSDDGTAVLWDIDDLALPRPFGKPLRSASAVRCIALTDDGGTLAAVGDGGAVRLWDVRVPDRPRSLGDVPLGHRDSVYTAAFSRDGRTLATGGHDHVITLWDVTKPARPRRLGSPLLGHRSAVASVVFSRSGDLLATSGLDGTTFLWDVRNPARPRRLGGVLRGHTSSVWSVAISADNRFLATGGADQTIILWDITDPSRPHQLGGPLKGHRDDVWSVAFSRDGKTLAAGSGDRTIILWDITDPSQPHQLGSPLEGHTDAIWSVAFSADGRTMAAGSLDGSVILWDVGGLFDLRQHTLDVACQRAGGGLSKDEWNRYISAPSYRRACG